VERCPTPGVTEEEIIIEEIIIDLMEQCRPGEFDFSPGSPLRMLITNQLLWLWRSRADLSRGLEANFLPLPVGVKQWVPINPPLVQKQRAEVKVRTRWERLLDDDLD
jgi:hypothetical protein